MHVGVVVPSSFYCDCLSVEKLVLFAVKMCIFEMEGIVYVCVHALQLFRCSEDER